MNKKILEQAKLLEPIVRIGKNGLTDSMVKELKLHLKKRKLIKVKLLRSFIGENNRKELVKEIADKTDSNIIQQIGFVVVLGEKNDR
jgi:RNA-binding protein|tara:strand:+ start:327 stop:587 length:261 start_codon:yes stop_codon:yes gene_type:complete